MNTDFLPVPDYVLNAAVRDEFIPTDKALFYQFSSGDTEPLVLGGKTQLREREQTEKIEFRKWLYSKGLTIPVSFQEDNDDVRFLIAHQHDF